MSLRRALAVLPDDRETTLAVREVLAFLSRHEGEVFDAGRVARATGLVHTRVETVLTAMRQTLVIDCDGDPHLGEFHYAPDNVLELEVRHFLRTSGDTEASLRRQIGRFRDGYGSGR